jgi:hypothetical protein
MSIINPHFLGMLQEAPPCTPSYWQSCLLQYALRGGVVGGSFTKPVFVHIFYHLESWFFTFLCLLYLLCWQITIGSLKTMVGKVTSLEAQTPFCHIFFRKNFIHEEILYITEQSTTIANMMSKLIVLVLVIVVCISSVPHNEKKNIVKKLEEKIISFFFAFLPQTIECFSCN